MEFPITIEQKWFYIEHEAGKFNQRFTIVDNHGFTIAENIKERNVVDDIINNHNKTLE